MLHVLATAALAQQWSYGYYQDKNCNKPVTTITLENKKGKEATGLNLGQCITSKFLSTEWSMKLNSCSSDANGRFTDVIECDKGDCKGKCGPRKDVTYKNETCVKVDGSYRKMWLNGACTAAPCFPSKAMVMKPNGIPVRVDALVEGDEIVATTDDGTLTTDTVSLLSIRQPEAKAQFLVLVTASNATLTLTPEHHLPVGTACCSTLKKARDVNVGETVWAIKNGAAAKSTVITAISRAPGQGLHSPVLTHGRLPVVDGLVTSFDSIDKVRLAQFGLAPLIAACKKSGTCAKFRELFLAGDGKYVAMAGSQQAA